MEKRVVHIDQAKAVGILLVIVGHCYWKGEVPYLNSFIYSFHMPLFFIIAGIFVKPMELRPALTKYFKAYLIPYWKVNALCFVMLAIYGLCNGNVTETLYTFLIRVLFASGSASGTEMFAQLPIVGAFWFLVALFWGGVFTSYILYRYNRLQQLLAALSFFALSYLSVRYVRMPFSLQAGMSSVVFMLAGHYGGFCLRGKSVPVNGNVYFLVLLMVVTWGYSIMRGGVSVSHCVYYNGLVDAVSALFGSIIFIEMIKRVVPSRWFVWTGAHTLEILSGHQVVLMLLFYVDNPAMKLPPPVWRGLVVDRKWGTDRDSLCIGSHFVKNYIEEVNHEGNRNCCGNVQ